MDPVQLTSSEFDTHIQNKTLRISFVGLSNVGKSYRSKVLRDELDFFWYHVDEQIFNSLGFDNMVQISEWLGFPYTQGYKDREQEYLELENKCTKVDNLDTNGKNLVFDTTGSVVHLKESTINWLRENCFLVNIETNKNSMDSMIEKFFEEPKPLVWSGFFNKNINESHEDALRRCYPELVRSRLEKYRKIANITIPVAEMRDLNAQETLEKIKSCL